MRCITASILTVSFASILMGQAKGKSKAAPAPSLAVACTDEASMKACSSFKQLVQAKDPEILALIQGEGLTYVCPRANADEFFVVSIGLPRRYGWTPSDLKDPDSLQVQKATTSLSVYSEGVIESFLLARGQWIKYSKDAKDEESLFSAEPQDILKLRANVDESEVSLEHEYTNRNDTQTINSQVIRRSTGRYKESWMIKDAKQEFQQSQGQCMIYRK